MNLNAFYIVLAFFFLLPVESYTQYSVKSRDIPKKITFLHPDESGGLWYGCSNGEVGVFDGTIFQKKHKFSGKIHSKKIIDGDEYILTEKGAFILKNDKYQLITGDHLNVLDISDDTKQIATNDGIYTKIGSSYSPDKEDFYAINEIEKASFFQLAEKHYLRVDGVIYKNEKSWKEYIFHQQDPYHVIKWNPQKMLIGDTKSVVSFDTEGYVDTLMQFESMVPARMFRIDSRKALIAKESELGILHLPTKTYEIIYNTNPSLIASICKDAWGNIWIASGSYLYQVVEDNNKAATPKFSITQVKVNGAKVPMNGVIKLKTGNNDLQIEYKGIHLSNSLDLGYQTRIVANSSNYTNGNNAWSPKSRNTTYEVRNLPAGKYSFEARATIDGEYFTYAKPLQFTVEDNSILYIWLTAFLGGLAVLLCALYFNNRYNTLRKKSDEERQKLIKENKLLSLQQKALQLQMNPHFVFNALNSIQGLIAKEDNKSARKYLREFSLMMRSVLQQSREEEIRFDNEITYLKNYLSLEQMANNDSFDFTIHHDESLEENIKMPSMVVQPFIENAILHGIKSLKNKRGKIEVRLEDKDNYILCTIHDNGVGRAAAAKNKSSNHTSIALDVVRERLAYSLPGKHLHPFEYEDLTDEENNPTGTKVMLRIPILS